MFQKQADLLSLPATMLFSDEQNNLIGAQDSKVHGDLDGYMGVLQPYNDVSEDH